MTNSNGLVACVDPDPLLLQIISDCMAPDGPDRVEVTLITAAGYITGFVTHAGQFLADLAYDTQRDIPEDADTGPEQVARPADQPHPSDITHIYLADAVVRPIDLAKPLMWGGVPMSVRLSHVIGWTLGGMKGRFDHTFEQAGMSMNYNNNCDQLSLIVSRVRS